MNGSIHPSAVVSPHARIADSAIIGPGCVIGPEVRLESGVRLLSHVVIDGETTIGEGGVVHPFSVIGGPAQTIPPDAGPSRVSIGAGVVIREHVTVHGGRDGGLTTIGDHCTLMAGVHIGHDCTLGRHVVVVNDVGLSGHCEVGDFAQLGGKAGCHQFVRIGEYAMLGGGCNAFEDVLPFTLAKGAPARISRLNTVGLERHGVSEATIAAIEYAVVILLERGAEERALPQELASLVRLHPEVARIVEFSRESDRGLAAVASGGFQRKR